MNSIDVPKNGSHTNGNGHSNSPKYSTSPNGSPFKSNFLKGYNSNVTEAEEL